MFRLLQQRSAQVNDLIHLNCHSPADGVTTTAPFATRQTKREAESASDPSRWQRYIDMQEDSASKTEIFTCKSTLPVCDISKLGTVFSVPDMIQMDSFKFVFS